MQFALHGTELLQKWAEGKSKEIRDAAGSAVKGAGYWLMKRGRADLYEGNLGLPPISGLTKKILKAQGLRVPKGPLGKLQRGVLYNAQKSQLTAKVGFLGTSSGSIWQKRYAYRMLTVQHLEISDAKRRWLAGKGVYLKKTSTTFTVPERDIIDAVDRKHGRMALIKLKDFFKIKLAGGKF